MIDDEHFRVRNPPLFADLPHPIEEISPRKPIYNYNHIGNTTSRRVDDVPELCPTITAVCDTIERLALLDRLSNEQNNAQLRYADVFSSGTSRLADLPTDVYHRFKQEEPQPHHSSPSL